MVQNTDSLLFISLPPLGIEGIKSNMVTLEDMSPPLGAMSLVGAVTVAFPNTEIRYMDFGLCELRQCASNKEYHEAIRRELLKRSEFIPPIICVSYMFALSQDFFEALLTELRGLYPDSAIIVGGAHATSIAEFFFGEYPQVDYLVCGEGELALPALIRAVRTGASGTDIPGVRRKDDMGANKGKENIYAQLPEVPNLDYELLSRFFNFDAYVGTHSFRFGCADPNGEKREFPIMASRGCPGSCTFCLTRQLHGKRTRWRDQDNIRDEILFLHDRCGVNRFVVLDDNYVPKNKFFELMDLFAGLSVPNLDVSLRNMNVNATDYDMIDAMPKASVSEIGLAIESGSPRMQKKIKKYCDLEKAKRLVKYAQEKGISVRCAYIIGFPGETLDEVGQTLALARELDAEWSGVSVAAPYPGTEMCDEFIKLGYIGENPGTISQKNRLFDTPEFSAKQIEQMAYAANLELNYANNRHIRFGRLDVATTTFETLTKIMPKHLFAHDCLRRIADLHNDDKKRAEEIAAMRSILHDPVQRRFWREYLHLIDTKTRKDIVQDYS